MMNGPQILEGHGHVFESKPQPHTGTWMPECLNCGQVQHWMGNPPCKLAGLTDEPVRGEQ